MIQDICCGFIHEGGPRCCWKWISRKANGSELGRLEHMRTASHRPNTCGHQFERKGVALNAVRCSLVRKAVLKVSSPYYRLYIIRKNSRSWDPCTRVRCREDSISTFLSRWVGTVRFSDVELRRRSSANWPRSGCFLVSLYFTSCFFPLVDLKSSDWLL